MSAGRGSDDLAGEDLNPTAARILSGLTGRDYECQTTGQDYTPLHLPWRGDDRQADKTRIWRYIRHEPQGVRFSKLVRDVFGQDAVEDAGADYQLARRFVTSCSYFKIDRRDGNLWVEPSLQAFNLSQQYANRKTTGQRRDGLSGVERSGEPGAGSQADSPRREDSGDVEAVEAGGQQYPKDRAKATISKRAVLDGRDGRADYRQELLRQLAVERQNQAGKYKILERVRGTGADHLLIPYLTRFNDSDRAGEIQDGFRTALQRAAEAYQDAVVLTVTADPKRHDSVEAALESLQENKGRLMSWLATDYQLGYRPDNLTVLEFQASGMPHYHIVLFGRSWLAHHSVLAAKWDDLGTGSVVDVRTARERGGSWLLHNDDGTTVTLQHYLGKAIRQLVDLAGRDSDDLRDAVEAGDVEAGLWRQALYWATGKQYYSCSPDLKAPADSDELPHITRWRFVGVARYENIPAHVKRDAVFFDRGQPPPGDGRGDDHAGTVTG